MKNKIKFKNMDAEKKETIGCAIFTIIIIALIIIGLSFFTRNFTAILATSCIFILPFLPFFYLYKHRQYIENITVEYEIQKRIEEYADELENLTTDIEKYDPKEYGKSPKEYLDTIKEEINTIIGSLKDFRDSLEDYPSFYQEIQKNKKDYNKWHKKSKEGYNKMVKERKKTDNNSIQRI